MVSNINESKINEEFPKPGQDNDSQGFRNNFDASKKNFSEAKSEIEELQNSSAKINENNNFNKNEISNATFVGNSGRVINKGTIDNTAGSEILNLSFKEANYYRLFVDTNDVTFTFTEWPDEDLFADLRIVISASTQGNKTIHWSGQPSPTFRFDENWPTNNGSITINDPNIHYVMDFWTENGGLVIYGKFIGAFSVPN